MIIIGINLFSRAQKLKFKEEYKKEFDGSILWHLANFLLSGAIAYLFIYFFFYHHKKKENKKLLQEDKDKWIIKFVGIDNILMFFASLINGIKSLSFISFGAISISGSINCLFYEYYSTQQVEYTSLYGFIAFGQVAFRLGELFLSFKKNFWYFIQIVFSLLVLLLCWLYNKFEYEKENIY